MSSLLERSRGTECRRLLDELLRVAWTLGEADVLGTAWHCAARAITGLDTDERMGAEDKAKAAIEAYTEQFALDPSNLRSVEEELAATIGRGCTPDFVAALNVFDGYLRLSMLLGSTTPRPQTSLAPTRRRESAVAIPPPAHADGIALRAYRNSILDPGLVAARSALARVALHNDLLDDAVTEAVRLRNAARQSCRYCGSLRLQLAQPLEVDDLVAAIASYETSTLPTHVKAALRVTDAFLAVPATGVAAAVRAARTELSAGQIADIGYQLVVFTANKTLVALGIDAPANNDGLSLLRYEDGKGVMTPLGENIQTGA